MTDLPYFDDGRPAEAALAPWLYARPLPLYIETVLATHPVYGAYEGNAGEIPGLSRNGVTGTQVPVEPEYLAGSVR